MGERLGTCSYPTLTQAAEGNVTQDYCEEVQGGTWTPNVPPIDPTAGTKHSCAVRSILCRALAENIMQLGMSYHLTYLFRDQILYKSRIGKQLVNQYYTHADELYLIVVSDPDILGGCIRAWGILFPFIKAMLEGIEGDRREGVTHKGRTTWFTKTQFTMVSKLIGQFRTATKNTALRSALRGGEGILRSYVGLTPQEALSKLVKSRMR